MDHLGSLNHFDHLKRDRLAVEKHRDESVMISMEFLSPSRA
jgi:hypothetical protein